MTLFQVDVFLVLSQDKVHLLLTLQLVLKNALMSLVKGFFALFPKIKKKCEVGLALGVGTAPRVEPIHAGCSAGGLRRVGAAQGSRRWQVLLLEQTHSSDCLEGTRRSSTTGTGTRVSVRMTSLLFLLGEGRHRQPRAEKKYWARCRLCCVEIFFTVNNGHWFCHPRGTLLVLEAITLVQLIPALGCTCTYVRSGLRSFPSPSLVVMVSQMS